MKLAKVLENDTHVKIGDCCINTSKTLITLGDFQCYMKVLLRRTKVQMVLGHLPKISKHAWMTLNVKQFLFEDFG